MSNLTIRINGRDFTVACAPGEEAHIDTLGRMIDGRLDELGDEKRTLSETRTLLYAALFLADDLHELRAKPAQPPAPPPPPPSPELTVRVAAIAERLEKIAEHLEEDGPSA